MARREVVDCDRCNEKTIVDPVHIQFCVGYSPCPAGGPSEREVECLDLCTKCAASLLSAAVTEMGEDKAAKWYKKVKGEKKKS